MIRRGLAPKYEYFATIKDKSGRQVGRFDHKTKKAVKAWAEIEAAKIGGTYEIWLKKVR